MRQTWQWKPNQTVHNYRAQRRYYGRRHGRYSVLAIVGAAMGVIIIVAAIAMAI